MRKVGKRKIRISKIRCHKWLVYMIHVVHLVKGEINLSLNSPIPNSIRKTKKNCYNFKDSSKNRLRIRKIIFIQQLSHLFPK